MELLIKPDHITISRHVPIVLIQKSIERRDSEFYYLILLTMRYSLAFNVKI